MSTRTRLFSFALVLMVAFGGAFGAGQALDPIREPEPSHSIHTNQGGH